MKKSPMNRYCKDTGQVCITAETAQESLQRASNWLLHGCNGFELAHPKSTPMAFWTEQDFLLYIKLYRRPIASVYGDVEYMELPDQMRICDYSESVVVPDAEKLHCTGCPRTGCIFCAFGAHLEKPANQRFVRLKQTHPKQYEYCIGGGEWVKDENGKSWWRPSKKGLGMGFVFDRLNEVFGEGFVPYE